MGGELVAQAETAESMGTGLMIVLVSIFFLMVLLFNSLSQPLIIMAVIPLAFVAVLIVTFSIVVPSLKLLLQLGYVTVAGPRPRDFLHRVVGAMSKWSMADVFVMSLLIVFLAGQAKGEMGDLLVMESSLETGFYWFLGYCIFSIASSQFIGVLHVRNAEPAPT